MSSEEDRLQKLEELFRSFDTVSPEKIQEIVSEAITLFEELLPQLSSENEAERKKAEKFAQRLKELLEGQSQEAFKKAKITEEQAEEYLKNPDNFSQDEWKALQDAEKEIQEYSKQKKPNKKVDISSSKKEQPKKRKNPKKWA